MAKRVIVGNTTATPNPLPDWNQSDSSKADYIKNKPELADVAISGSFNDLIDAPDYIDISEKGARGGVASLDNSGKVPAEQLPFNLDGIVEGSYDADNGVFINADGDTIEPEPDKLYSDVDSGKSYRWGGSAYVEIANSLALGTTSSSAYRGDYGHVAYTHSQITSGNPHNVTYAELPDKPFPSTVIDQILKIFGTNGSIGLKYDIYDDHAVCTGMTDDCTETEIEIASIVKGVPVTEIGEKAFDDCGQLTSVIIPYGIEKVGSSAFHSCEYITKIEMPNSITSIGAFAFNGTRSLKNIVIPNSLTRIDRSAFYGCTGLTNVTIPSGVAIIDNHAFHGCTSLVSVTIPDSVTSIGDSAFYNCTSLTNITIPDGVTSIGNNAFEGCTKLTEVDVARSVEYIAYNAFGGCNNVASMKLPFAGGSAYESTYLGYIFGAPDAMHNDSYVPSKLKNVIVTQSVGDYAFNGCVNLTNVTILPGVISIGASAFHTCKALSSVIIPNTITNIGTNAFTGCISLVDVSIPDSVTSIGNLAFSDCLSLTNVLIPNSVTNIGDEAFQGCSQITYVYYTGSEDEWVDIDIEQGNSILDDNLYYYSEEMPTLEGRYWRYASGVPMPWPKFSTSLTYTLNNDGTAYAVTDDANCADTEIVILPIYNGLPVTDINASAFSGRTDITSVVIPDSITTIGNSAFANCTNLKSVTIGNGITNIGTYAFDNCPDGGNVYISDLKAWCSIRFANGRANPLYNLHSLYLDGVLLTDLVIPDDISDIYTNAFIGCRSLKTVTMGDGVTYIGDSAFSGCSSISQFTIGRGVQSLGASVFSNCTSITTLSIPNSVESIGTYAFRNCRFTSIAISNGVTYIGPNAFENCNQLTSVIIPNSVEVISVGAFVGCTNLISMTLPFIGSYKDGSGFSHIGMLFNALDPNDQSLYIPHSLKSIEITGDVAIGPYAFYDCTGLTNITMSGNVTSIGMYAFNTCELIQDITIPDTVASIGEAAFDGCTSLKTISIPGSVKTIGKRAFSGCESLFNAIIGDGVTSIDDYAFSSCIVLTDVSMSKSVTSIGTRAFRDCRSLARIDYTGTVKEWNVIDKASDYDEGTGSFVIYCTDGQFGN